MIESTMAIQTRDADFYVMSLCKRWPEKMDLDVREQRGIIHFDDAVATLTPSTNALVVSILANDAKRVSDLQNVVVAQLMTVLKSDELVKFEWKCAPNLEFHAL